MDVITVTRPDTTTYTLFDTAKSSVLKKYEQKCTLMGEDIVTVELECSEIIAVAIGDKITYNGLVYTVNTLPKVKKIGARWFEMEITFEGVMYDLIRVQYLNLDATYGTSTLEDSANFFSTEFSLTGSAEDFLDLMIYNLDRVFGAGVWVKGTVTGTLEYKTLTFSGENCLAVMQRVVEEFELLWSISQAAGVNTIKFQTVSTLESLPDITDIRYGYDKGLYEITRSSVDSESITTRLYAYGSTKNLPSDYRGYSSRLKIDDNQLGYIENATAKALYGLKEETKIWDDIFPHFDGTLSDIGTIGTSLSEVYDTEMPFDLKAEDAFGNSLYWIPGTSPKMHFNSGNLAGYEFEVADYDHVTFKFTLIPYKDERNCLYPNPDTTAFQPAATDKYVLLDINMPQSLVDTAEDELEAKAIEYLNLKSKPNVSYDVEMDSFFVSSNFGTCLDENYVKVGYYIKVVDTSLGLNDDFIIKSFTRDITYPDKYNIELSNDYRRSRNKRRSAKINALATATELSGVVDSAKRKWGKKTVTELHSKIFTIDEEVFKVSIIPRASITGEMIASETIQGSNIANETIGADQIANNAIGTDQLVNDSVTQDKLDSHISLPVTPVYLDNIEFEPNYGNDYNKIYVDSNSGGVTEQAATPVSYDIASGIIELTGTGMVLLFAKCKVGNTTAEIIASATWVEREEYTGYVCLFLGVVNAKETRGSNDYRTISLNCGRTSLTGESIRNGIITGSDVMAIDLSSESMVIGTSIGFEAGGSDPTFWLGIDKSSKADAPHRAYESGKVIYEDTANYTKVTIDPSGTGNRNVLVQYIMTGTTLTEVAIGNGAIEVLGENSQTQTYFKVQIDGDGVRILDSSDVVKIGLNHDGRNSFIKILDLPAVSDGLDPGCLWRDGTTLKITPEA